MYSIIQSVKCLKSLSAMVGMGFLSFVTTCGGHIEMFILLWNIFEISCETLSPMPVDKPLTCIVLLICRINTMVAYKPIPGEETKQVLALINSITI